jgi:MFS superfamily sulfate permease-like transporter
LLYANADRFTDEARALVESAREPVRWFLVDADAVADLDYSAARTVADLASKNVSVVFARVSAFLRADLDRHGITSMLGEARIFATLHDAIETARAGRQERPAAAKAPAAK